MYQREVLATRKEKDDLEQEKGLLKMDIRKILKEKSSLEEEVEALKSLSKRGYQCCCLSVEISLGQQAAVRVCSDALSL
uniref:Uncharacterized protein n=1 Tax=Magallana gigas TaxID=29159 RepID=K1Q356_MAGGI